MENIFEKLVQDFEQGKMSRRQLIQSLMLTATAASAAGAAPAAADAALATAAFVHHVTWDVKDHMKCSAFYRDVLGMKLFQGNIKQEVHARCGQTYLTWRGPGARPNRPTPPVTPNVEHIAIAVDPWPGPKMDDVTGNPKLVAWLKQRGDQLRSPTGSLYVKDPEGFNVQLCGKNWTTEG